MNRDFRQIEWDEALVHDARLLIRLAVQEDLDRHCDWTTVLLAPAEAAARVAIVARKAGVACGLRAGPLVFETMEIDAQWTPLVADGDPLAAGQTLAEIHGRARDLLTAERTLLNLMGRLAGVATLTRQYVDAAGSGRARVYDTRKTTPGWRRLEKYAVGCGGGRNHRLGLYDAVLIKDNHLALAAREHAGEAWSPAAAVEAVRGRLAEAWPTSAPRPILEVEVDTLEQLASVLAAEPDIVLLDNMDCAQLRRAVELRDQAAPGVELEASGGVTLDTIGAIAATGIERVSVGAITHQAVWLDLGLDWLA